MNLELLAEKINKRWPNYDAYVVNGHLNISCGRSHYCINPSWNDHANATFIVWALDRLGEMGMAPTLYCDFTDGYVCALVHPPGITGRGKTRAEACAKALYAALEGE